MATAQRIPERTDVLIIGAGPAGIFCALQLLERGDGRSITMVEKEGSKFKVPAVNPEQCIGCGACEFHCPARPVSAIYVEGHEVHKER